VTHSKKRKGFTLVELVIVVLILGILAAVAAPKLLNTSATAIDNSVKVTLDTVRDAIELYAADHAALPGQPTGEVDLEGNPISGDLAGALEPYIRGPFPGCPVGEPTDPTGIVITTGPDRLTGVEAPTEGWKYNSDTGEFIINSSRASNVDAEIRYDQF